MSTSRDEKGMCCALEVGMPHLKVTQKGIVSPQRDIDLEVSGTVPHVAATLRCTVRIYPVNGIVRLIRLM